MKKRTRAREIALQALYQLDVQGQDFLPDVSDFLSEEEPDRETVEFALGLVRGVYSQCTELDRAIAAVAQNWDIGRMAIVDRNVLRMASFELLYRDEIPPKVSINEAIELGKRFSTKNSGAFINGILDRIKTRAQEATDAAKASEEG